MASFLPTDRTRIVSRLPEAQDKEDPWALAYVQDITVLLAYVEFLARKRDQAYDCAVRDNKTSEGQKRRLKEVKKLFGEIEKRLKES